MESSKTTDKTRSDIAGEVLWTRKITFQAAVVLISFLVLFSHRSDAILNAQFYAEDGARNTKSRLRFQASEENLRSYAMATRTRDAIFSRA